MKLKGSTLRFMFGASLMALTAASAHAQAPAAGKADPAAPDDPAIVKTRARPSER